MKHIIHFIIFFSFTLGSAWASPPGVIGEFSSIHFDGRLAQKGEVFNSTDVIEFNAPRRRIIDYMVTSSVSFLWYEHGGIAYHQHLVSFRTVNPNEIISSYSFGKTKHGDVYELVNDREFLRQHIIDSGEL